MELLRWQGLISMVDLGICGAIAIDGDKDVYPLLFLLVGAWLPSPTNGEPRKPTTPKKPEIK